jgi:hypothetical protein
MARNSNRRWFGPFTGITEINKDKKTWPETVTGEGLDPSLASLK